MGRLTDFARNQLRDHMFRTATMAKPAAWHIGLLLATKGYWKASTTYALGDTVIPSTPNGRIYKCTTAGTTAAGEPAWPTVEGQTVTDGTAVFTEQSLAIEAGTFDEVAAAGAYARVANNPSDANWTAPSTGAADNAAQLTFPAPTADWTPAGALIAGYMLFDAATAGNGWWWTGLTAAKSVMANDPAPNFAANAASYSF